MARTVVALAPHFETLEGADDLSTEIAACDLALAAFGVTAYELAAYGCPALYLCLTQEHADSAAAFEAAGMGLSLGLADGTNEDAIANAVGALLGDAARRRDMRAAGRATIDGNGATRIAAHLAKKLAETRSPLQSAV